jgi:hypothetical protein
MTSGFQETKSAGEYNIVKDKTEYDLVYNHREYKDVLTKKKCSQTNVGKIYSEPLAKKIVVHVHIRTQLNVIG